MQPAAELQPGDVLLCAARWAECRRLVALADTVPGEATPGDIHLARVLAAPIGRAKAIVVDAELPPEALLPSKWRIAKAASD